MAAAIACSEMKKDNNMWKSEEHCVDTEKFNQVTVNELVY